MLSLLNCRIILNKSKSFFTLSVLIYLFTGVVLYESGISIYGKLLISCLLIGAITYIGVNPYPAPAIESLCFIKDHWILKEKNGQEFLYDSHSVLIEAGLFFLLHLKGEKSRTILIFFDQLDDLTYRSLKIIERVRD